ncbi:MAG: hypothetical protein GC154_14580 [bacterium]|nr:hypothetical protein [bacterium]
MKSDAVMAMQTEHETLRTTAMNASAPGGEITPQALAHMEKLAAIGQLTSSVAHEMRNLLGVIRNAAYNIDRSLPSEDGPLKSNVELINRSVSRARQFIENLLNLSRPAISQEEATDVRGLIDELLALFSKEMEWRRVELAREYQPLGLVRLDRHRLQECLLNLIINAIQSMENGGVLTVRVSPWLNGARIEIEDTGCGVAPEDLTRIFERFYTTKANGQGTGLGLTISRSLARELGGEIEVDSTLGRGSVFTLMLPRLTAAGSLPAPPREVMRTHD